MSHYFPPVSFWKYLKLMMKSRCITCFQGDGPISWFVNSCVFVFVCRNEYFGAQCFDENAEKMTDALIKKEKVATKTCCGQVKLECKLSDESAYGEGHNEMSNVCMNMKEPWAEDDENEEALRAKVLTPMRACCKTFKYGMLDAIRDTESIKGPC